MGRRIVFTPINWHVVLPTTLLCAVTMVLFFASRHRTPDAPVIAVVDTIEQEDYSELEYYNQMADDYLATLPADREVIARLIDEENHYIYYFECTDHPSCYSYDLESLTTSVLFGGEAGFYSGTKLLIVGTITDGHRVGDRIYFVARNHAPEAAYANAIVVFSLHLFSRQTEYVTSAAGAYFSDSTHMVIQRAKVQYVSLFTDEPVYTTEPITIELQ